MQDLLLHTQKQRAVVRAALGDPTEHELFQRFFPLNKNVPWSVAILQSLLRWNQYKLQARTIVLNRMTGDTHTPHWWAHARPIDIKPELHTPAVVAEPRAEDVVTESSLHQCRKCKSRLITYYEMQTRSADEPATVFFTCHKCKNHWRQ